MYNMHMHMLYMYMYMLHVHVVVHVQCTVHARINTSYMYLGVPVVNLTGMVDTW